MLFAGFNVSTGRHDPVRGRRRGRAGNVVGSLDRLRGRLLRPARAARAATGSSTSTASHLEWADRWFERHGDGTVFFARMLPIIRTFISLPAGVARMPFWRFTLLTLLGCIPWVLALALDRPRGRRQLGGLARPPRTTSTTRSLAAIVVGIVYLLDPPPARPRSRPRGRGRGRRRPRPEPRAARRRSGAVQGPTELLPGLELRAPLAAPLARRLGLGGGRPRGAQELRGRAARRRRGGAADRPAPRDRRRARGRSTRAAPPWSRSRSSRPAIVGYTLERQIEARLGGPRTIAAGLVAGAVGDGRRRHAARRSAGPGDAGAGRRARARRSPRPPRWSPASRATARR